MSTKNDDLPICLNCGSSVTDWNSDAEGHFCSHCHERVYLPEHLRAAMALAEAFDAHNRNCLSNDSVEKWSETRPAVEAALLAYRSAK